MSSSHLEGPAAAAAASGEVPGRLGGNRTGAAAAAGRAATSSAARPAAIDGRDAVAVADPDADQERLGGVGGFLAWLLAARVSRFGVAPPAGHNRQTAFPRAAADAAPPDLVAPVAVVEVYGGAPLAGGVADVEPHALAAPAPAGAPLIRAVPAAGLPDLARPSAAPRRGCGPRRRGTAIGPGWRPTRYQCDAPGTRGRRLFRPRDARRTRGRRLFRPRYAPRTRGRRPLRRRGPRRPRGGHDRRVRVSTRG